MKVPTPSSYVILPTAYSFSFWINPTSFGTAGTQSSTILLWGSNGFDITVSNSLTALTTYTVSMTLRFATGVYQHPASIPSTSNQIVTGT